jgi:hypothetical protein
MLQQVHRGSGVLSMRQVRCLPACNSPFNLLPAKSMQAGRVQGPASCTDSAGSGHVRNPAHVMGCWCLRG